MHPLKRPPSGRKVSSTVKSASPVARLRLQYTVIGLYPVVSLYIPVCELYGLGCVLCVPAMSQARCGVPGRFISRVPGYPVRSGRVVASGRVAVGYEKRERVSACALSYNGAPAGPNPVTQPGYGTGHTAPRYASATPDQYSAWCG